MQGSGKTLAFGLPILQLLDAAAPAAGADAVTTEVLPSEGDPVNGEGQQAAAGIGQTPLRALVLEPTRELAMQVSLSACTRLHRAFLAFTSSSDLRAKTCSKGLKNTG